MIDGTDLKILNILQANARTSNAQIARDLGMAPSAILERIRKLEERGVITGYEARIDPSVLGLHLLAFVFVRSDDSPGEIETGRRLTALPGVQEVHHIAGEDCYLVKVRTADPKALSTLLREEIGAIRTARTRTTVVLDSLCETAKLPLPGMGRSEPEEEVLHGAA